LHIDSAWLIEFQHRENGSRRTGENEEDLITLTLILLGDMVVSEGVISGEGYKPPPQQAVSYVCVHIQV